MGKTDEISTKRLEVALCTYGRAGIEKIASAGYPRHQGVSYLVCWQQPEGDVPEKIASRNDFKILKSDTVGIAVNRTIAMRAASAPICLITDDDVDITSQHIHNILQAFANHPEADIITMITKRDKMYKLYPDFEFDWKKMPKGYFVSATEIAIRPERVKHKVAFNPAFGINTTFLGGEEDNFVIDALQSGLKGIFVPMECCAHEHQSTGNLTNYSLVESKGAIIKRQHPATWPLRLLTHLYRDCIRKDKYNAIRYIHAWIKGIRIADREKVFNGAPRYDASYEAIAKASGCKFLLPIQSAEDSPTKGDN